MVHAGRNQLRGSLGQLEDPAIIRGTLASIEERGKIDTLYGERLAPEKSSRRIWCTSHYIKKYLSTREGYGETLYIR